VSVEARYEAGQEPEKLRELIESVLRKLKVRGQTPGAGERPLRSFVDAVFWLSLCLTGTCPYEIWPSPFAPLSVGGALGVGSFVIFHDFYWTAIRIFPYYYAETVNGRSLIIDTFPRRDLFAALWAWMLSPRGKPGMEPS
jgi:hypothetical protein